MDTPATRRKVLAAVTTVALVAVLAGFAVVGWRALTAPLPVDEADIPPEERCAATIAKGDVVRAEDVQVSVFNAGDRPGLAGEVRKRLVSRGFLRGEASNAPKRFSDVSGLRVLARKKRDPAARLVARQFGRGTPVTRVRGDLGPGVDVVVGNDFVGLAPAPQRREAKVAGSGC